MIIAKDVRVEVRTARTNHGLWIAGALAVLWPWTFGVANAIFKTAEALGAGFAVGLSIVVALAFALRSARDTGQLR